MLKILHAHLLRTFVANSKTDAIYALYPESLSNKYLAVRKVFAFSDSAELFAFSFVFVDQILSNATKAELDKISLGIKSLGNKSLIYD